MLHSSTSQRLQGCLQLIEKLSRTSSPESTVGAVSAAKVGKKPRLILGQGLYSSAGALLKVSTAMYLVDSSMPAYLHAYARADMFNHV